MMPDKKQENEMRVYFCPKCESTNVKYIFELGNLLGIIPKQRCMDCNLELNSFPILVTTKRAFMDHGEKKRTNSVKRKNKIRKKKK